MNIPVGMLIALDSVQNKSLVPRIHSTSAPYTLGQLSAVLLKLSYALRYLNSILACLFVCDRVCHLYGYITNRERCFMSLC